MVSAELLLDLIAIESIFAGSRGGGRLREERGLQARVAPIGWHRPADGGGFGTFKVPVCGADRYRAAPSDLALVEIQFKAKLKDFSASGIGTP